jgi:hypothetical protein
MHEGMTCSSGITLLPQQQQQPAAYLAEEVVFGLPLMLVLHTLTTAATANSWKAVPAGRFRVLCFLSLTKLVLWGGA